MLLKQYEEVIKYKVTKGDTITKIGLIYNINTKLIKSANPKLGDNLHPGDIILLPIKKMSQVGSTHLQQDSSIRSDDFVIKSGPKRSEQDIIHDYFSRQKIWNQQLTLLKSRSFDWDIESPACDE